MFRIRDGLLLGTTVVIDGNGNLTTTAAAATTAGSLTAARTIALTGSVIGSVSTDLSSTTTIATLLANTAVTPGTYRSVTVAQDGRITGATNPTTISGYGIIDAQPLDAGLSSLSTLTGTGVVIATATDTFAMRAIGAAASTDILDRASGDGRYAALAHTQDISTINGLTAALDGKADDAHVHAISDTTGLQSALNSKLNLSGGTLTGALTLYGDPSGPHEPATKQYVDNALAGLDVKESARAASTGNLTLSGNQTVDGVALVNGNRVLVKNQTTASQNGIYVVATGAWSRSTDMDAWTELPGSFVFINEGSVNINTGWVCSVAAGGTLGTTDITFNQFAGAGNYTAGTGLVLTSNEFALTGQALAFHSLATNGLVIRSGSSVISRSITGSTGLTVTNADGSAGDPTLTLATKLSNLSAMDSTAGLVIQTGTDAFTKRTLAIGSGLSIVNETGVSGDPTISLSTSLANLSAIAWSSGTQIPILTAANTWSLANTGTGSTNILTGSLADARYAALAGATFTGSVVLPVGTTSNAPLRFQGGALLSTPVAHALEWNGTDLYVTTSGVARKQIAYVDGNITGSAAKWTTARNVSFSTGQVTGSFSIDGSADVSAIPLTISAASVTGAMLASAAVTTNLGYTPASRGGDTLTGTLTFAPGTTAIAPAKFQAGALLSTPVAHSIEWNGSNAYVTNSGGSRQTIQYLSDPLAWNRITSTPTTLSGYGITDAVSSSTYTASDVLAKLLTVDGNGSGLDADLLDGQTGPYYTTASNLTGTLADARLSSNVPLKDAANIFTVGQSINTSAAAANFAIDASAGQYRGVEFKTAGVRRWFMYANNDAETGGNGSTFTLDSHNDAGTFITNVFTVTRSTGVFSFGTTPTVSGQTIWHAGNDGATSGLDADLLDGQQGVYYQNASNLTAGTLLAARLPAFTGDITTSAGSAATTLATVNSNAGAWGSATQVGTFTVNAKGLVTASGNITLTPAWGSITGTPTTLTGYGITDAQSLAAGLTSIAGLTGVGAVVATATNSFAMRAIGAATSTDLVDRASGDTRYLQTATANSVLDARYLQLGGGTLTGPLVLSSDPTLPLHASTKQYVDNAIQGLDAKQSVRAATTSNIALTGAHTIDGIAVISGDRVLVKDQTDPAENGIYVAANATWVRSDDFNVWAEIPKSYAFVEEGAASAATGWVNNNTTTGTLGTTAITFVQFSGSASGTASTGVTKVGNDFQLTGQALALHNLATNGLIARTASGAVAARNLTAPAAGITVSDGNGVAGNPTLALANDLAAVEALSTTGFVRRTGTDTWSATTLTGAEVTTALGYTPFHPANDGTGSGLDADLLDGLNADYFTNATNMVAGILSAARGGTGLGTFTANTYVRATTTSSLDMRTYDQVRADIMAAKTVEDTTPPTSPNVGDGWVDSNSGTKYNYVSGYWVEL